MLFNNFNQINRNISNQIRLNINPVTNNMPQTLPDYEDRFDTCMKVKIKKNLIKDAAHNFKWGPFAVPILLMDYAADCATKAANPQKYGYYLDLMP